MNAEAARQLSIHDPATKPRLHPSAARMLDQGNEERVRAVLEDRMIHYPMVERILDQAQWLIHEPRSVRARGIIVAADPGNGKSSIASLVRSRFNDYDDHRTPSVVVISMSGARDSRTVYGRIMEELGAPARTSHRLGDRELLVKRLLRNIRCRLLILDEVQDILTGSEREQKRSLEGIKLLMNGLMLPVLAFGTDGAAKAFSSDPHMAARFDKIVMGPWIANDVTAGFLATYERVLPLRHASDLGTAPMVATLVKLSAGNLSAMVRRIRWAAAAAIIDGTDRITKAHLVEATSLPKGCPITMSVGEGDEQ